MASISFVSGPHAGSACSLPDEPFTIGRGDDAGIAIQDDAASWHHIQIGPSEAGWVITDLDSANGTLVNDVEIQQHILAEGDIIAIGDSKFCFYNADEPEILDADNASDEHEMLDVDTASDEPEILDVESVPDEPELSPVQETATVVPEPPASAPAVGNDALELVHMMRDRTDKIRRELSKVIVGQADVVEQILMCIVAGGHALLIGLPGMAKTLTVATLAKVLNLQFKRVQFTPDLMPSDIIGTDVLETNQSTGDKEFRFIRGPIFCNLLLADEINRTPPKTQAALLEAMQEKCVTAGNATYTLDKPFFVLATQNPIEQEGTYPLPEAQLDRFMFNIWVDYPEEHEEELIVGVTTSGGHKVVEPVMTREEILQIQEVVRSVPVSEHVIKYAIRMVRSTRPSDAKAPEITKTYVSTGAGPRAGQYLILAAKAMAVLEGRIHISCSDIRRASIPVLRHRIMTNFAADSEGKTPMDIVQELIKTVKEPTEEDYAANG